jgi:hypothetical protein
MANPDTANELARKVPQVFMQPKLSRGWIIDIKLRDLGFIQTREMAFKVRQKDNLYEVSLINTTEPVVGLGENLELGLLGLRSQLTKALIDLPAMQGGAITYQRRTSPIPLDEYLRSHIRRV